MPNSQTTTKKVSEATTRGSRRRNQQTETSTDLTAQTMGEGSDIGSDIGARVINTGEPADNSTSRKGKRPLSVSLGNE